MERSTLNPASAGMRGATLHSSWMVDRRSLDLGVVIVSHDSADDLTACLGPLFEHAGGAELGVVISDAGSSDGTASVAAGFPVAFVPGSNEGFARCANRVVRHPAIAGSRTCCSSTRHRDPRGDLRRAGCPLRRAALERRLLRPSGERQRDGGPERRPFSKRRPGRRRDVLLPSAEAARWVRHGHGALRRGAGLRLGPGSVPRHPPGGARGSWRLRRALLPLLRGRRPVPPGKRPRLPDHPPARHDHRPRRHRPPRGRAAVPAHPGSTGLCPEMVLAAPPPVLPSRDCLQARPARAFAASRSTRAGTCARLPSRRTGGVPPNAP